MPAKGSFKWPLVTRLLTLVANSRQQPIGRNLGKMGPAGYGTPRFQTPQTNSPPVSLLGLPLEGEIGPPRSGFVRRLCIRKADEAWGEAARDDGLADTRFFR